MAMRNSDRSGDASHYIARETAISAVINAAISMGFFLAVFGLGDSSAIWGLGNYAFDFLPQSFAVAFFASVVPSLLARKAVLSGTFGSASDVPGLKTLLARSIILGMSIMVVGAGLCTGVLWLTGAETISLVPALSLKTAYGAALGALVTYKCLTASLMDYDDVSI